MRRAAAFLFCLLFVPWLPATDSTPPIEYWISLEHRAEHKLVVRVAADAQKGALEFQLPVWNATYQVRDFARNINWVRATTAAGVAVPLKKIDKTTWRAEPAAGRIVVEYEIVANEPGPFGAQTNGEHTFLNLAEVAMYPVGQRDRAITLHFTGAPSGWKMATALPGLSSSGEAGAPTAYVVHARNYDHMVDSPVELGRFDEVDFDAGGAHYRVVIHGAEGKYKKDEIAGILKKITTAETDWMGDRPFAEYTFIYHFPDGPAGGGMEHAYSTAIDVSANRVSSSSMALAGVSAHEFFHLWNVKRIRPQTLEPVDYTRENYTRALWFSEGVTSTVGELTLARAGFVDEAEFLKTLAGAIATLQGRPAHLTQSAEESSLDTWFDKYSEYREPERSINYYNKGLILGFLLDLKMREATGGKQSLRDLFRAMNEHYAKAGKFFPDSDGVRETAESLTHTNLKDFFARYVAGTAELPYQELFATVGLRLERSEKTVADPGFRLFRNFGGTPTISEITGENARAAGVTAGDQVIRLEKNDAGADLESQIGALPPGSPVKLTLRRRNGESREVTLALGSRLAVDYGLTDVPGITAAQRARRKAWIAGEDEGGATP